MEYDEDQELVRCAQCGDHDALCKLVRKYRGPLFNAAFRILGNAEDAADTVQDVCAKLVEKLDSYDNRYKFFSWLYRVALNQAIDQRRRRAGELPLQDGIEESAPNSCLPDQVLLQRQRAQLLHRAMARLSVDHRTVITLRHFSELGYSDIARALSVDEKTVKSRLFDARKCLALSLGGIL